GVQLGVSDSTKPLAGFPAEVHAMAHEIGVSLQDAPLGPLRFPAVGPAPQLPERFARLALPLDWPVTPIETLSERDLDALVSLLDRAVRGQLPSHQPVIGCCEGGSHGSSIPPLPVEEILKRLSVSYGASGHEAAVRETVLGLLPAWAKPETDASGNLILHFGSVQPATTKPAAGAAPAPSLVFVAHLDEIGYEVKSIAEDGRL